MSGVSLRMMLAILASGDAYYFGGVAVLTDRLAQQVPESQIGPLNLLVVEHVGGKSPKPYEVRPVGQDGPPPLRCGLEMVGEDFAVTAMGVGDQAVLTGVLIAAVVRR